MRSEFMKLLANPKKHNVGNLNMYQKDLLVYGAILTNTGADKELDNYCLVEDAGFALVDGEDERVCKPLSANTVKGYLLASVEEYMPEFNETLSSCTNVEGERCRLVGLTKTKRFEASNFELADSSKALKKGQKVHYDATKKKFIISNGTADHADYAAALNKCMVVDFDKVVIDGKPLVKFEIV